jgi:hypothetical protein
LAISAKRRRFTATQNDGAALVEATRQNVAPFLSFNLRKWKIEKGRGREIRGKSEKGRASCSLADF